MSSRWQDVRCEANSLSALVQQLAVQLVPRGYWYYVTGVVPARTAPEQVDKTIIEKYDIREDPSGRRSAHLKRLRRANIRYLRHGRFYVIIATKGEHLFKRSEQKNIRTLRKAYRPDRGTFRERAGNLDLGFEYAPLLVPLDVPVRAGTSRKKTRNKNRSRQAPEFEGYAISFRPGGYLKKTPEERAAYLKAMEDWKKNTELGRRVPKPPRGMKDDKWRCHTEIEEKGLERLEAYLLNYATVWPAEKLAMDFRQTPYEPYFGVKRQLFRILKKANAARKMAGRSELRYNTVLSLKREQIPVFKLEEEPQEEKAA